MSFVSLSVITVAVIITAGQTYLVIGLSDRDIDSINSTPGITWKAKHSLDPGVIARWRKSLDKPLSQKFRQILLRLTGKEKRVKLRRDLPASFDARIKWRNCTSLNTVRDQSNCVSGFAVNTAATIIDHLCIGGSQEKVNISGLDLLACAHSGSGCCGGYQADVWNYYVNQGVVTGGAYGSKQGCIPYSLAPCHHSVKEGRGKSYRHQDNKVLPTCKGIADTPKCVQQCREGYSKTYSADKHFGEEWYWVQGEKAIMQELVDHGPLTASMEVWEDFYSYKSGVYKYVKGEAEGSQVVKLLGYGTENGQNFWLAANSWNTDWGEKGFFKIARGTNECQIEHFAVTGKPQV